MNKEDLAKKLIRDRIINCVEWYMSPTLTKDIISVMNDFCSLVTKNESINWILPSEKLPEEYEVVLVCLQNGRVRSEEFVNGEFIDSSVAGLDVLAWAEMVKAPYLQHNNSKKQK